MTIWIDAQISPAIAAWISSNYPMSAVAIRDLGLRDAEDKEIFEAARLEKAVVMTKDSDFVLLLDRLGPPPQVIWVTCGNTSNGRLKEVLTNTTAEGA
jgi:predicted nuclease of predicted toxin-antitoxin system